MSTRRASTPATSPATEAARGPRGLGIAPEVLRQVRLVELRTRGLVNSLFSGEYHSVFKGQGMEFSEVREYQVGDEVRIIDWNVSARMGRPFVKRFIEERELNVMLMLDVSGSERFGTVGRFKHELGTELCAVLAMAAIRNNDRVGLLLFTDRIEHFVPPRKGRRHVLRLIRDLIVHEPQSSGTDLAGALEFAARTLHHRAIVFLVSDFIAPDLERPLKILAKQHDLVAVSLQDPGERALPDVGLVGLVDPETGETIEIDTSDPKVRRVFALRTTQEAEQRRHLLRRLAIDEVAVKTETGFIEPLLRFFRARERRAARA